MLIKQEIVEHEDSTLLGELEFISLGRPTYHEAVKASAAPRYQLA